MANDDCPKCGHPMMQHTLADSWGAEVYQCWAADHPYAGGRCGCKHLEAKLQDDGTPLCATCGAIVDSDGCCISHGGETHETCWMRCRACTGQDDCEECCGMGLVKTGPKRGA